MSKKPRRVRCPICDELIDPQLIVDTFGPPEEREAWHSTLSRHVYEDHGVKYYFPETNYSYPCCPCDPAEISGYFFVELHWREIGLKNLKEHLLLALLDPK